MNQRLKILLWIATVLIVISIIVFIVYQRRQSNVEKPLVINNPNGTVTVVPPLTNSTTPPVTYTPVNASTLTYGQRLYALESILLTSVPSSPSTTIRVIDPNEYIGTFQKIEGNDIEVLRFFDTGSQKLYFPRTKKFRV